MRLMISVVSAAEARQALAGGAGLVDIKNPAEGSLGAHVPRVIREIRDICSNKVEISAAIGDMPNLPGSAALAALGAAVCGADYIKVGLMGPRSEAEARAMLREMRDATSESKASIIAACYADYERAGTMNPGCLPDLAASANIRGCLIDTAIKDGSTLFEFLDRKTLHSLAREAHAAGLLFAVAGSLREEDLPALVDAGVDVVGLRTAVCRNSQRSGPLDPARVLRVFEALRLRGSLI
jgi:(5-formylfuran-3-yl)methyl phosphate synthase